MNAFETYLAQLASLLPSQLTDEVQAELKADLDDELDDYRRSHPSVPTDVAMVQVIAKRQSPEAIAASLRPPSRALIGSLMYPIYQKVIVAQWLLVIVAAIAGATSAMRGGPIDGSAVMRHVWGGLTSSFLITTITFALLDRFGFARTTPPDLIFQKKLHRRYERRSSRRRRTIRVIIATLLVMLAGIHPAWVGLPYIQDGIRIIPLFRPEAITKLMPVADVFVGALIADYVIAIIRRRFVPGGASVALRGLMLVCAFILLIGTGGPSATAWTNVADVMGDYTKIAVVAKVGALVLSIAWWGGFIWAVYRWVLDVRKIRGVGV
ncbi:hypothetical protein DWU98_06320 [Dyella monticola]|uniref:Uncharacterized protein n=1 Tax=Dyella monticola TaxID=1927958 RepID=A0A370X2X4_9GAMM|nr:hypothetical protein [Dyella monticola]RDS82764.1 hypothetical protein DWU98_06320 [Dyella monticola]